MNTTGITLDMEIAAEDEDVPKPEQLQSWLAAYSSWLNAQFTVTGNTARFRDDNQQAQFSKHLARLAEISAPLAQFLIAQANGYDSYIALRVVSAAESQMLNSQYRQKDRPTNVLSFPGLYQPGQQLDQLGDLAICASVVTTEARTQEKTSAAHWAHLLLHGTLHLLGFDHETDDQAQLMESLETQILASLGFADPYAISNNDDTNTLKNALKNDAHSGDTMDSFTQSTTTQTPITEA